MEQFYCERDSIAYQHGSSSCPLSSYNASAIPFTFSLLPIPSDTVKADRDAWCTNDSAQNLCHYKVILMVHRTVHHRTSETVMVQAPSLGASWPLDSKPIKSLDPPMNSWSGMTRLSAYLYTLMAQGQNVVSYKVLAFFLSPGSL